MHLSMSLSQTQRLEQKLEMKPDQRMELKMELAQRMGKGIQDLLRDSKADPEKLYDLLANRIVEIITQLYPGQREFAMQIGMRMMHPPAKQRSVNHPLTHAIPRQDNRYVEFIVDCIMDETNGEFDLGETGRIRKTTRGTLQSAFGEPDKLDESLSFYKDQMRETKNAEGLLKQINEAMDAQFVREYFRPIVDNLVAIYQRFITQAPDVIKGNAVLIFHQFFRDLIVHNRISFLVAEHLQATFATAVKNAEGDPDAVEEALLQALGEYTLISMGFITPDAFTYEATGSKPTEDRQVRWKLLRGDGEEEEIVRGWHKATRGRLSLSGWRQEPSMRKLLSPEAKVAFVRRAILEDRERIFAVIPLDEFQADIDDVVAADGAMVTKQAEFRRILTDALEDEKLKKFLIEHMCGAWYDLMHELLEGEPEHTTAKK